MARMFVFILMNTWTSGVRGWFAFAHKHLHRSHVYTDNSTENVKNGMKSVGIHAHAYRSNGSLLYVYTSDGIWTRHVLHKHNGNSITKAVRCWVRYTCISFEWDHIYVWTWTSKAFLFRHCWKKFLVRETS